MSIIIHIGRVLLQLIFDLRKTAPVTNKITVISRQSNAPSLDIRMLEERLRKEMPDYEVVVLCRMLDNKVSYLWHMLTEQMPNIATSKVVVLDSYCILISFLRQRRSLKVVQMWHALGAYKKFGKSILGQEEGSSARIADLMHMHRGYDRILASSEESCPGFMEAFGYGREAFDIIPLPRVDLLRDPAYCAEKRAEILAAYPVLSERETILFAPTLRRGGADRMEEQRARIREFAAKIDPGKYNIIVSPHPVISKEVTLNGEQPVTGYSTMELLTVANHFVTDYSATIYEAAVMGIRTYVYAYDLEEYVGQRGFYLDPYRDLPSEPYTDADEVVRAIEEGRADPARIKAFADRYVDAGGDCTGKLVERIRLLAEQ